MRLLTMFLVIATCCGIVLGQWNYDESEAVPNPAAGVGDNLAVDGDGNVLTVFRSGSQVVFRMREADTNQWLALETVTDSLSMGTLGAVSIAWNPETGQPVVAFESNHRIWFAQREDANIWSHVQISDSGIVAYTPDIAANSAGTIYVAYVIDEGDSYQLNYGYFNGVSWTVDDIPANLGSFGTGALPKMAVDENGAGHVIFRSGDFTSYVAQHATNEQEGNTDWVLTTLTVPHPESYPGDIVAAQNGSVYCVSSGSEGFGMPAPVYIHRRDATGDWNLGQMCSADINGGEPLVAVDSENIPHTMWLEVSGNFYTGYLYYTSAASFWQPEEVYDNIGGGIAFVVGADGYGHLLLQTAGAVVRYLRSSEPLGNPTAAPELTIDPVNVDFDSVEVGQDSVVLVRLENSGDATLTITDFQVVGNGFSGPPGWFVVNLAPGAFMQAGVQFTPVAEQNYLGYVLVWTNAPTNPDTVYLSGAGYVFSDAPETPLPLAFELRPLYPNPFNGAVNVSFTLPREVDVSLKVFDVLGREVGTLVNGQVEAGLHNVQWNCAECAAGIYLFRLEAAGQVFVQKAAFVK